EEGNTEAIRGNAVTNLMFLPSVPGLGDLVVDLSQVQTISAPYLKRALAAGDIGYKSRLSQLGYYIFVLKLTIHLLRTESADIERQALPAEASEHEEQVNGVSSTAT
ncbi:MAG: hypothetical protein M3Y59_07330, partial [Myxococcota bacterium]|nr:hypothetical protein [Myxococcota bacterium]